MKKRKRRKKVDRYANLLSLYQDPSVAGGLGGVVRFAKAQKLPVSKVRERLEGDLGYTLHKPTRGRFPTLPVLGLGHGHGRTVDGRFDQSGDHCPIQSRVSVSVDGGGRVVQVRLGGTRQIQDG